MTDEEHANWRSSVCKYLSQHDLAALARVNRAWNTTATAVLYTLPDLSRCNEVQLLSFLSSVKASKARRRNVQILDLLVPINRPRQTKNPFESTLRLVACEDFQYRYIGPLFESLFSVFKNLSTIRIYGHGLTDCTKAHWRSLGNSLVELKIYNLGSLTDNGLLQIAERFSRTLQSLHIEHRATNSKTARSDYQSRMLRVGTIDNLVKALPKLKDLGIGIPLLNISNNKAFLEALFELDSVSFVGVPDVDFLQLNMAPLDCKWRSLSVHYCSGMRPEDLEAVFRRLPLLVSLDWRFTDDTYYDWTSCELKTASCRRLKHLTLENCFLSDQCLMRILRVTSNLESLALASCENIHRIRPACAAGHYVFKDLASLMPVAAALEDCVLDIKTLQFVEQRFSNNRSLVSALRELLHDAVNLQYVDLIDCNLGKNEEDFDNFSILFDKSMILTLLDDDWIRITANPNNLGRGQGSKARNRFVPDSAKILCPNDNPDKLTIMMSSRSSAEPDLDENILPVINKVDLRFTGKPINIPEHEAIYNHTRLSWRPELFASQKSADCQSSTQNPLDGDYCPRLLLPRAHSGVDNDEKEDQSLGHESQISIVSADLSCHNEIPSQSGWGTPNNLIKWGTVSFELIEQQRRTKYWNPLEGKIAETFVLEKSPRLNSSRRRRYPIASTRFEPWSAKTKLSQDLVHTSSNPELHEDECADRQLQLSTNDKLKYLPVQDGSVTLKTDVLDLIGDIGFGHEEHTAHGQELSANSAPEDSRGRSPVQREPRSNSTKSSSCSPMRRVVEDVWVRREEEDFFDVLKDVLLTVPLKPSSLLPTAVVESRDGHRVEEGSDRVTKTHKLSDEGLLDDIHDVVRYAPLLPESVRITSPYISSNI